MYYRDILNIFLKEFILFKELTCQELPSKHKTVYLHYLNIK